MKFCPECGSKLPEDAKFCFECGFKISNFVGTENIYQNREKVRKQDKVSSEQY